MARRGRISVPSIADMMRGQKVNLTAYERAVLGTANQPSVSGRGRGAEGVGQSARAQAQQRMGYDLAMAMQEAKEGDDHNLLPYQPTPSINPPRPRTLAAGYDKDTQVMRVRFREGAVYGYANVTPTEWRNFKRVKSPGRAINRTFNAKPYWREPMFDYED
jgi:hypothetical protein